MHTLKLSDFLPAHSDPNLLLRALPQGPLRFKGPSTWSHLGCSLFGQSWQSQILGHDCNTRHEQVSP